MASDLWLLNALHRAWARINADQFGGTLKTPTIGFLDREGQLGEWDSRTRTLRIRRALVDDQPWPVVIEVLKHEMAHQYVVEVLGITDEPAHGPAFRRVCADRGIDAAAQGLPKGDGDADDPIVRKVRKLLALAASANQAEAESAMNAAHRLMRRHNIDTVHEGRRYGVRVLGAPSRRLAAADKALAGILGAHFFVLPVIVGAIIPTTGEDATVVEITGTEDNLAMAEWVWQFVRSTGDRLWAEERARSGAEGRARGRFLLGVMNGFSERLRDTAQACEQTGLIWKGDPALKGFVGLRHPHLRTTRRTQTRADDHYQAGRAAGRQIVLHRPIEGGPSQARRALTDRSGAP